jgi:hypothetical protein
LEGNGAFFRHFYRPSSWHFLPFIIWFASSSRSLSHPVTAGQPSRFLALQASSALRVSDEREP